MDVRQLKILLEGVDVWSSWRRDNPNTPITLEGADLEGANLVGADLYGADLHRANLRRANLQRANLRVANLEGADLWAVNLEGAYLEGAYLEGANLRGANLEEANLEGARIDQKQVPQIRRVPEQHVGFIGYKKVEPDVVLKLLILGECTNSTTNKCRTSKVKTISAFHKSRGEVKQITFNSSHNSNFKYTLGEISEEPNYNPDFRVECSSGIHFFLTYEEARDYYII